MLDWAIVAARMLQYASVLTLFGSSLFFLYGLDVEPTSAPVPHQVWPRRILLIASIGALAASMLWLMAETASLTGDAKNAVDWASLWSIVSDTGFGRSGALRMGALALSAMLLLVLPNSRRLWTLQALLGGALVASFAWTGHGSMDAGAAGLLHRGSDVLHLLAAGIWIGALLPLSLLIGCSIATQPRSDTRVVALALQRFSRVGAVVVSILILSGLVNSWFLIGATHWRELFTTAYGRSLIVKLALFALMLVLAVLNRYRLSPALTASLETPEPRVRALQGLRRSVSAEMVLALLVIAVVALLGTLEPPVSQ